MLLWLFCQLINKHSCSLPVSPSNTQNKFFPHPSLIVSRSLFSPEFHAPFPFLQPYLTGLLQSVKAGWVYLQFHIWTHTHPQSPLCPVLMSNKCVVACSEACQIGWVCRVWQKEMVLNGTTNLCKRVMETPELSLCGIYSSIIGLYFTIYCILWHECKDDPSTILSSVLQTHFSLGQLHSKPVWLHLRLKWVQAGCVSAGSELYCCYLLGLGVKQLQGLHSVALMTLRVGGKTWRRICLQTFTQLIALGFFLNGSFCSIIFS